MERFMNHDFTIDEITFANVVKAGTGTPVHKNRKSHGIAFFPGGERTLCFDNKKITVTKDTVVYFPKGCNYVVKEKIPFDCYAINFQMPDGASFEPFAFKIKNPSAYLESFRKAQWLQARKNPGYLSKIKAELYNIVYYMQSEYTLPYVSVSVIEPAIDYIHSNYDKESIRVEHLASLCGISTVYLRTLFVKRFGKSPLRYVNDLKMFRAKELLSSRYYRVSEVCTLSGYSDESYFCREFKKHFGMTPNEYMKLSKT